MIRLCGALRIAGGLMPASRLCVRPSPIFIQRATKVTYNPDRLLQHLGLGGDGTQLDASEDILRPPKRPRDFVRLPHELAELDPKFRVAVPPQVNILEYDRSLIPNPPSLNEVESKPHIILVRSLIGGACRRLMINKREQLNAIDLNLARDLKLLIRKYDRNETLSSFMMHTTSSGLWLSSGTDWKSLFQSIQHGDHEYVPSFFRELYQLAYSTATVKKPYLPILDGLAMGSAAAIFMDAPIRIVTPNTVFMMPETAFGFFPDCGTSHAFSRMPDHVGMYIALTGRRLRAADMLHLKLATHYMNGTHNFIGAEDVLSRTYSHDFRRFMLSFVTTVEREPKNVAPTFTTHLPTLSKCFGKDSVPEIMDALREDGGEWAMSTLRKMETLCPLSLVVTHKLVRQAATMTREEVLKLEYQLAQRMVRTKDFAQGMKVLVLGQNDFDVDRPRHATPGFVDPSTDITAPPTQPSSLPKWQHDSVKDVTKAEIEALFTSSPDIPNLELVPCRPELPPVDFPRLIRRWMKQSIDVTFRPEWMAVNGDISLSKMINEQPLPPLDPELATYLTSPDHYELLQREGTRLNKKITEEDLLD